MVGMMMSLAGKTAELGVFRSFIQTAPGGDRQLQYPLPYDPTPTPKHPGLRVSLRWQVQTPRTSPKWPFCFGVHRRSSPPGSGGQHTTGLFPSAPGLGRARLHNRWERGDTALLAPSIHCAPFTPAPAGSPLWGSHQRLIAGRQAAPPASRPARHLGGRAGSPQPAPAKPSNANPGGRRGSTRGSGTRSRPTSPARAHTRTAVEGVDPGEARQAPMAQRLHARGSARLRRRRLRQIGNPTLIAQQRREGAGGGPRRPKLPSAGWRRGGGRETGSREERSEPPGRRGRAGEGRRAPPGALPAPAAAASPAADPGAAAPQPARQLATSPGLLGAQGRGAGAATNRREAPAPPPPPRHASRPPAEVRGAAGVPHPERDSSG